MPQSGSDLGERMKQAFNRVFSEGWRNAVLIGSDIPDLTPGVISEALGSLEKNDAVIGQASDGGYYLIGFNEKTFLPRMFHGIPWGTPAVFRETMKILTASTRTVHLAPEWQDVDTLDDLKSLFERNRDPSFDNSRTMTYLRMHRNRLF
jgi:rSAM/selenodomain-associated transferase 1